MILSHLVERSETWISYSQLLIKVKVDGLKSNEMSDTISDAFDTCICDLVASSQKK